MYRDTCNIEINIGVIFMCDNSKVWKVYCYTGENNKKYIGITSFSLYERAGKDGEKYVKDDFAFGRAIKKYGFNFFTVEILEDNLTYEEACGKEKYYIQYFDTYRNGYNSTLGGDGCPKYNREEIYNLWNEGKGIQQIKEIVGCDNSTIQKILNSYNINGMDRIKRQAGTYHLQEVHKYDLDGYYIESYISYSEAGRLNNIPHANIIKCIKQERQTAGGFQWRTDKVEKISPYIRNKKKTNKVYQYDLNKKLVSTFESIAEASRQTGFSKEYLSKKANENGKAYEYYWSHILLE